MLLSCLKNTRRNGMKESGFNNERYMSLPRGSKFAGSIEKSAGKHRWKSRDLPVLKESVPVQRSAYRCYKLLLQAILLGAVYSMLSWTVMAQEPVGKAGEPQRLNSPAKEELSPAPAKVDVNPVARDEEILKRLQSVLDATDWFTDPQVRVEEGVVFLNGQVESEELKKWAGDLARNTQDVVAVANRMEVLEPPVWDFRPASNGLLILWRDFIRSLPFIVFGLLILALSVGAGMLATGGSPVVPSPTDSDETPAKCDRSWGGRARFPLRCLYHSESLWPDSTGIHGSRRHRPDRSCSLASHSGKSPRTSWPASSSACSGRSRPATWSRCPA